ncbi:MAG: response regulator transcription factor [Pirellulales bacterium]
MTPQPSIILVDDHLAVSEAVAARLASAGFRVVERLESARGLIGAVQKCKPDLVLLDVSMPGPDPFEAAARVKNASPGSKVMFFSAFTNDRYIDRALESGADGYLTKGEPFDQIVKGIEQVLSGGTYWSPPAAERVLKIQGQPPVSRLSALTPREAEVLRYLAQGMNCDELAKLLGLSRKTVEKHQYHLRDKLRIYTAGELTLFALREGLIAP